MLGSGAVSRDPVPEYVASHCAGVSAASRPVYAMTAFGSDRARAWMALYAAGADAIGAATSQWRPRTMRPLPSIPGSLRGSPEGSEHVCMCVCTSACVRSGGGV